MSFVDDLITSIFSLDETPPPAKHKRRRNALIPPRTTTPPPNNLDFSEIDSHYHGPKMNIKKVPILNKPPHTIVNMQPQATTSGTLCIQVLARKHRQDPSRKGTVVLCPHSRFESQCRTK